MNRHTKIFFGIFSWMTCLSCVALAVINGLAAPPQPVGVALFVGLALLTAVVGYLLTRSGRVV